YSNIQQINSAVVFGELVRNMHRWAAHLMVITVTLHMIRVFYHGAYKPPREFNWVVGVVLFLVTLLLSFTGYLLPWDQIGYWALPAGSRRAPIAPIFGPQAQIFLPGQPVGVGGPPLTRFYTLHVIGLPLIGAIMMAVHFWRIRKDGGEAGPPPPSRREIEQARAPQEAASGLLRETPGGGHGGAAGSLHPRQPAPLKGYRGYQGDSYGYDRATTGCDAEALSHIGGRQAGSDHPSREAA